jgi:NAD(P)-dependent dehydrogenase (short-subunit alcohol dehydrogenase family)
VAELSGQVALVTGASQGIGRHLVDGLAERGAAVVGLARNADRLTAAMSEVAAATGARTLAVAADVMDVAAVEAVRKRVLDELGQVDLLVNNAGLIDAAEVPVWEADPDQWWQVVTSHIRGPQLMSRAVVPAMVHRGSGRIINLVSSMGTRAEPDYSAYSIGKCGLMRLTETLATTLAGTGVHAFDVAPGLLDTAMTRSMPKWRDNTKWTPPEKVVELVAAIASGRLDAWSGRFMRAGVDDIDALSVMTPEGAARQLRLRPYGDVDPLG